MIKSFFSMLKNDDGASLVEYALIIALVAGLSSVALHTLGTQVSTSASTTSTELQNADALIQTAP